MMTTDRDDLRSSAAPLALSIALTAFAAGPSDRLPAQSIVRLAPIADATSNQDQPAMSYGSSAELWFGKDFQSQPSFRVWFTRGHVQFDLSPLQGLGVPHRAQFNWYQSRSNAAGCLDVTLHRITAAWSEQTVTWSNQPSHDPAVVDRVCVGNSFNLGWKAFDVTSLVQDWLGGVHPNHGFVIRDPTEQTAGAARPGYGHSRESSQTTLLPYLELDYGDRFGTACGSPAKIVVLGGSTRVGSTLRLRADGLQPGSAMFLFLGFSKTQWGPIALPFSLGFAGIPCDLLVSVDASVEVPAVAGTFLDWQLRMPTNPAAAGISIYSQVLGRTAAPAWYSSQGFGVTLY